MIRSPHAERFGEMLRRGFSQAADGGSFREVRLFRALRKSIIATAPHYPVEEFHGARSQVVFSACPPWTKTVARCELSDLCIIWFRRRPKPSARVTFLQAKRSCSAHKLCNGSGGSINEGFDGDSTQWYLLNKRPALVGRFQSFQPPTNLLKDALLPSVATYCVFHEESPQEYSFFYASADVVTASMPSRPGQVQMTASAPSLCVRSGAFIEQKWACCPLTFGAALFSGWIGTPFDYDSITSPSDDAWRASVRRWIGSVLTGAVQNAQVGPVIQAFLATLDLPLGEVATAAPARALLFIQGGAS